MRGSFYIKIDILSIDIPPFPFSTPLTPSPLPLPPSKQTITQQDAQYFLEDFKCVLNRRGVGASPVREEKEGPSVVAPSSCYRAFGEGGERVVRRGKVSSVGGRGGGSGLGGGSTTTTRTTTTKMEGLSLMEEHENLREGLGKFHLRND